jgi:hypothetical protein
VACDTYAPDPVPYDTAQAVYLLARAAARPRTWNFGTGRTWTGSETTSCTTHRHYILGGGIDSYRLTA